MKRVRWWHQPPRGASRPQHRFIELAAGLSFEIKYRRLSRRPLSWWEYCRYAPRKRELDDARLLAAKGLDKHGSYSNIPAASSPPTFEASIRSARERHTLRVAPTSERDRERQRVCACAYPETHSSVHFPPRRHRTAPSMSLPRSLPRFPLETSLAAPNGDRGLGNYEARDGHHLAQTEARKQQRCEPERSHRRYAWCR